MRHLLFKVPPAMLVQMLDRKEIKQLTKVTAEQIFQALADYQTRDQQRPYIELTTDQASYELDLEYYDRSAEVYRSAEWIAYDTILKREQQRHYMAAIETFDMVLGNQRLQA